MALNVLVTVMRTYTGNYNCRDESCEVSTYLIPREELGELVTSGHHIRLSVDNTMRGCQRWFGSKAVKRAEENKTDEERRADSIVAVAQKYAELTESDNPVLIGNVVASVVIEELLSF